MRIGGPFTHHTLTLKPKGGYAMKTTPLPELTPVLKQLRLSGILDSLDSRNREAIKNKLSYPGSGANHPGRSRPPRAEEVRHASAPRRLPWRQDAGGFDFDFNRGINQQLVTDLAQCRFIEESRRAHCRSLRHRQEPYRPSHRSLRGATGLRCDVHLAIQLALADQCRPCHGRHRAQDAGLTRVPLLIVDDFGLKPFKAGQDEDFHDLVAERYERTATVITSNLEFTEWGEAFPNKLLGASTLDRLRHAAYQLVLDGKSYRTPRGDNQPENTTVEKGPKTAK
jgi:DNA replication protein DnaC